MKCDLRALLCLLVLSTSGFAEDQVRPVISVLDFQGSGISKDELAVLTDYLCSAIVETGKYRVIERTQRDAILQEIAFSQADCTDQACQIEAGRMLSADRIVVGSVGRVSSRCILSVRLIDVATGETIGSASEKYVSFDELIDNSLELIWRLTWILGNTVAADREHDNKGSGPSRSRRRGSAIEVGAGYIKYVTDRSATDTIEVAGFIGSLLYTYQFSNTFSMGLGMSVNQCNGEYPTGTYHLNHGGPVAKVIIGNKVDGIAFSVFIGVFLGPTGSDDLWDFNLRGGAGVYFRSFYLDIASYQKYGGFSLELGYSLYLGS